MTSTTATKIPDTRRDAPKADARRSIRFFDVLAVEFRKLFSTRANLVLLATVVLSALATALVCVVIFEDLQLPGIGWFDFAQIVVMFPHILLLPALILMVTSEWSTRSAMTTFTLVPNRGLVVLAKFVVATVMSVLVWAMTVGLAAASYAIGAALNDVSVDWAIGLSEVFGDLGAFWLIAISAFALAMLIQNGAATIVVVMAIPPLLSSLIIGPQWLGEFVSWIYLHEAAASALQGVDGFTGDHPWAKLAVSASVWIIVPGVLGLVRQLRREAS